MYLILYILWNIIWSFVIANTLLKFPKFFSFKGFSLSMSSNPLHSRIEGKSMFQFVKNSWSDFRFHVDLNSVFVTNRYSRPNPSCFTSTRSCRQLPKIFTFPIKKRKGNIVTKERRNEWRRGRKKMSRVIWIIRRCEKSKCNIPSPLIRTKSRRNEKVNENNGRKLTTIAAQGTSQQIFSCLIAIAPFKKFKSIALNWVTIIYTSCQQHWDWF